MFGAPHGFDATDTLVPDWLPAVRSAMDPQRRLAVREAAAYDAISEDFIQDSIELYARSWPSLSGYPRSQVLSYMADLIAGVARWQDLARRVSLAGRAPRGYSQIHAPRKDEPPEPPEPPSLLRPPEPPEPPDWGAVIRAESDPQRAFALQQIAEYDGMTEENVHDASVVYLSWSADESLYCSTAVMKHVAYLIEDLEIWQSLVRQVCLAGYHARPQLRIHDARRALGELLPYLTTR
jgi:hypothetical protein